MTALGIYIHVPFCRTRCRYCDFYRVGENGERQASFLTALGREIETLPELAGAAADTVFFGGGTPSLLSPEQVAEVLRRLASVADLAPAAEVTVEANPSDLDLEKLRAYRAAGVNRLSLGVQSFSDRELRLLGRRHDAARAAACVGWARAAGFENVSLDLMLAVPGQTAAGFRRTLERAIALAPDHLSLYLLEVHPRSEIDFLRRERPRLFPGEEAQRRRYLAARESLARAGYEHYEVSNFCQPGRASRHNLKYWRCEPYLGLGPSAHSHFGGRRWRQPPDLQAWLADPLLREDLASDLASERVFLGLRLAEGVREVDVAVAARLAPAALARKLDELSPFLSLCEGRLRFTTEGLLVSTAVLAELLMAAPSITLAGEP